MSIKYKRKAAIFYRGSVCRKTSCLFKNGVSLIACSVGFASCKTFGKQPKHPCFGAKPPAGTRGGSSSKITPSHGEGVWGFGKDAEIERPKALQGRKAHKAFLKG